MRLFLLSHSIMDRDVEGSSWCLLLVVEVERGKERRERGKCDRDLDGTER